MLVKITDDGATITYGDLSRHFRQQFGETFSLQFWGRPLGELSELCCELGLPAIWALVVNQETGMPGEGFYDFFGSMKGWGKVATRNVGESMVGGIA